MDKSVCEMVREMESNYKTGFVHIGDYVDFYMHKTIENITAYLNSRHINGLFDSLDREKPFFNIVVSTANIWQRATDIDRKDIRFVASNTKEQLLTFVANAKLRNWMDKAGYAVYLNKWGRTLARYGSAVRKVVKSNGELNIDVVPWSSIICDARDFKAMPVIEKLYYTPAQLQQKKEYDQDMVKELIEKAVSVRKDISDQSVDNQSNFIEIYEIHGNLPLSLLTDDVKDKNTYRQQMHVVSFILKDKDEYEEFTLFRGKEEKSPYTLTHLIEEDDRTLAIGAVETLFDAQWMMNHTAKQMKDYLDMASQMIFQTADQNYLGRNVLTGTTVGNVLVYADNKPLTQVNTSAGNISALESYANQWRVLTQELTSTPEAYRGITPPSGTPYSTVATLVQQAGSLFGLMVQNKGLDIEKFLREDLIPFLKTQMDTSEEITAILEDYDVKQIDSIYVPKEAIKRHNAKVVNDVINLKTPSPYMKDVMMAKVQEEMATLGNQRFFKPDEISSTTWKKVLKDFEWKVQIEITGENVDKRAALETLANVFRDVVQLGPQLEQNPNAKMLLSQIMNLAGVISPIQMTSAPANPPMNPTAPMMGAVGVGNNVGNKQ